MERLSIPALLLVTVIMQFPRVAMGQADMELESYALYKRKMRRLQATGSDSIVRYDGGGMHFFDIFLGNPAQKRTLAVTTNSDHTAFACQECNDCGKLSSNVYNSTLSSTFSMVPCQACSPNAVCERGSCGMMIKAKDLSSWSGIEVRDHAFHGGGADPANLIGTDAPEKYGFQLKFFCLQKVRGFFETSVKNGILGMSPAPTSFINQMFLAGKLKKPRFSLCFNDNNFYGNGNGNGNTNTGVVTFGGVDAAFLKTEMVYTKKLKDLKEEYSYRVNITKLHLRVGGGQSVSTKLAHSTIEIIPNKTVNTEAVLDSSVPYLILDKSWEPLFVQAWEQATGKSFSNGRAELTFSQLESLPTLLIEIQGDPNSPQDLDTSTVPNLTDEYNVLVAVPASRYMERISSGSRSYRVRIHFDGKVGSTLGASIMQGHSISYEIDKERIGIAESHACEASNSGSRGRGIDQGNDGTNETTLHGTLSINTAGSESSSEAGATSESASGANDDIFIAGGTPPPPVHVGGARASEDFKAGGCTTAACRCFMAIGYVFIGTALAVTYRASRPKERTLASFDLLGSNEEPYAVVTGASAYRRKVVYEGGTFA